MDAELEQKLSELRAGYAASLPGRLAEIGALWKDVRDGQGMPDSLQGLRQRVHSLAGSGKTFGFSVLSDVARNVELALEPLAGQDAVMSDELKSAIGSLLATLDQAVAKPDLDNQRH